VAYKIAGSTAVDKDSAHTVEKLCINCYLKQIEDKVVIRQKQGTVKIDDIDALGRGGFSVKIAAFKNVFLVVIGDSLYTLSDKLQLTKQLGPDGEDPPKILGTERAQFAESVSNVAIVGGGNFFLWNPNDGLRKIDKLKTGDGGESHANFGYVLDVIGINQQFVIATKDDSIKDVLLASSAPGQDDVFYNTAYTPDDSDPDETKAIEAQASYFFVYNRSTISLYDISLRTGNNAQYLFNYSPNLSVMMNFGIVGRDAYTRIKQALFFISDTVANEEPDIYVLNGSSPQSIGNFIIQDAIKHEVDLSSIKIEAYQKDKQDFLVLHLNNATYQYSLSTSQWNKLESNANDDNKSAINYRNQYFVNDSRTGKYIVFDKYEKRYGYLDMDVGTEYGQNITATFYTEEIVNAPIPTTWLGLTGNFGYYKQYEAPVIAVTCIKNGLGGGLIQGSIKMPIGGNRKRYLKEMVGSKIEGSHTYKLEITGAYKYEFDAAFYTNEEARALR
tara:strand:- start:1266 stop:2768 length:1503 start_codon:yes stop_codon:yes gene_type:complete